MSTTQQSRTLVQRLFKLEAGEGRKVLHFALLGGLMQAGVAIGMTTGDALFLVNVGVEKLPYIYLATPFLMLAYVPAFTYLISRYSVARAFSLTGIVLVIGGGLLFFVLRWVEGGVEGPVATLVYYVVKLYAVVWYIALYSLFWNFVDEFFDIQDGKRLFAFFSAGAAAGATAGGMLVVSLSGRVGLSALFLAWSGLALLTLPLIHRIRTHFPKLEEWEPEAEQGFADQIRETVTSIRGSRYVLLLMLALVTSLILTTVTEYQYFAIFSAGTSEAQLASLLGWLFATVSVFNLVINLFVFNRLVLSIGVNNVTLVQPVTYLIVFTLLLLQGGMPAAVFGFFAYHGILTSIDYNNQNFLFNAVPVAVKKQVRTVIEGMAEPVATGLGGAFLLIAASRMSPVQLSTFGLALAGVFLVITAFLRNGYLPSLVTNLKKGWLDLSRPASEVLAGLGPEEISVLVQHARTGKGELARCALRLLWINDRSLAQTSTLEYLDRAPPEDLPAVQEHAVAILRDGDPERIRELLTWVSDRATTLGTGFIEEFGFSGLIPPHDIEALLDSGNPEHMAAAVVAFSHSWLPEDRSRAAQALTELLAGDDGQVAAGVRAIGNVGEEVLGRYAVSLLTHASPRVRTEALKALKKVCTSDSATLLPYILDAIADADDKQRYAGLEALGKIGDPTCVPRLLAMGADFPPPVRRNVSRVLTTLGLRSVPASVAVLRDDRFSYRARVMAARGLGTIALAQLEALSPEILDLEIERAQRFRRFRGALAGHADQSRGLHVLSRFYEDMEHHVVDFILQILALSGRLPDFEMVSASLRSGTAKERANALETIEQGLTRRVFQRLLPLLDGTSQLIDDENAPLTVDGVIASALQSPFPLEAAAAAQALWERDALRAAPVLRARMQEADEPLFRETALGLASRPAEPDHRTRTPIDEIFHMSQAPLFQNLPVWELKDIADLAEPEWVESGHRLYERGETADEVFVILAGSAVTDEGVRAESGSLIGEEPLLGTPTRSTGVVSQGAEFLRVPLVSISAIAEASFLVAMELIRYRAEEHDVFAP